MSVKSLALCIALAFPMAMMAQSMPANNNYNNGNNGRLSQQDHKFLHNIAQEDQSEINLAHLALQKSSNPQVRQYAQSKILAADQNMEQQAKNVAEQENTNIDAVPSQRQQQEYETLSHLNGSQFDQAYMRYEARKQSADLNMVNHEMQSTSDQPVQNFASNQQSPVRQASQRAETIASNMGQSWNQNPNNPNNQHMNNQGTSSQGQGLNSQAYNGQNYNGNNWNGQGTTTPTSTNNNGMNSPSSSATHSGSSASGQSPYSR